MIPPDQEIYELEKRIAERRERVERATRDGGRQAMRALTSPWALAGAALLGFLAAGGLHGGADPRHYERRRLDKVNGAAKAGGIASVAMAAASWAIKSQFGSPLAMAQFFLSKLKRPSPRSDRPRAARPTLRA
jgi:hypothetical protein